MKVILLLCVLLCIAPSLAQNNNKLLTEDKWIGALAWTVTTLMMAGIAGAFMATDWQLWIGRGRQKQWMTGIISVSFLTLVAISLGIVGITIAWANLQTSKNHKNTQDTYSAMLALYLATYGFLIFFGFVFFNRKSLPWGVIFWLLAVASAVATLVLMWWINTVAFGIFFFFPVWIVILGIILFVAFKKNKEHVSDETILVDHRSHHYSNRSPSGHHEHTSQHTNVIVEGSDINWK